MTTRRIFRPRRLLKAMLIALAVLILGGLGLHIWFVNNARSIMRQMVEDRSGGTLRLELRQLYFNFFTNHLSIRKAALYSTDTLTAPTTYAVQFDQLGVQVESFFDLLVHRRLSLDSILLNNPSVTVTRHREDSLPGRRSHLAVHQEMGKLYNSMLDALEDFGIRRIIINNARLALVDRIPPATAPVVLSNIYFNLQRSSDTADRDAYVRGAQTVDLRTTNQNIALPGGRHRLAFKNFSLELFRRRIVLDSCTLTARTTDSSRSAYTIFFDKLLLIGVDFDAMYRYNLIRADSVYCENPLFNVSLDRQAAREKAESRPGGGPPDAGRILRELTGDLDLAFVGVRDAGIRLTILGEQERTLFNSSKDDFELRGLSINSDSAVPVSVDRFDMLVQDYRLYSEDSASVYGFDSIHFSNNRIVLNDFTVTTEGRGRRHNKRDFRIPYFELTGLDWQTLIFDQSLRAQAAVLRNPVIRFERRKPAGPRRRGANLFTSLESLDSLMTLDRIAIINGTLDMKLSPTSSFSLQGVQLSLLSNRLLQSDSRNDLRSAVEYLSFRQGEARIGTLNARLTGLRYTGRNLMEAERIRLDDRRTGLKADVRGAKLNNVFLNEATGEVVADGLTTGTADIQLQKGTTSLRTRLTRMEAGALSLRPGVPPEIERLSLAGSFLQVGSGPLAVRSGRYGVTDGGASFVADLELERFDGGDSLRLAAPRIDFVTDVQSALKGAIDLLSVRAQSPQVTLVRGPKGRGDTARTGPGAPVTVGRLELADPSLRILLLRGDSLTQVLMPNGGQIVVSGFKSSAAGVTAARLEARTTDLTVVQPGGSVLGVDSGSVRIALRDIGLRQEGGKPAWSAVVEEADFDRPLPLLLSKRGGRLEFSRLALGNLNLASEYLTDFPELLRANVALWLRTTTGRYSDSISTYSWYGADYDYSRRRLSLDSFAYRPTQPLDTVMARTPYQTDYLTFRTGGMAIDGFDLDRFERDSALLAGAITLQRPHITIFRDKAPPFLGGVLKPLPVDALQKIPFPMTVGAVRLQDGTLEYTERHPKSRAEGTLVLSRMQATIGNLRNRSIGPQDSLTLSLDAYLMDSALLNLRVRESYTDTLSGFLMTLRMRPTTLSFLNPVLAPLSNVQLVSGTIDSLYLRAIGREYVAAGEMNMFYRNLKIRLVKGGDEQQTTFLTRTASWLINAFIIRKNNRGRTGLVYFERLRDRSFFNYLVKTTFSGMTTSIGVKSNRKVRKQYRRALQEQSLPPIDLLP